MIATILRATALSTAAGYRMMTPLAALSWAAASGRTKLRDRPFNLLHRPWVVNVLWLCALGEFAADKLPFTPSRTAPGPLAGRMAAGAAVSAAQFVADKRSPWIGAALGAAVAGAQTFASSSVRRRLNDDLPNPLSGSVGDAAALAYALPAVARRKRRRIW